MRTCNKWRIRIGNLYLDLAEKLATRKTGVIANLQKIRAFQRRTANREWDESRPPHDSTIRLKSFQFSEFFLLEDIPNLEHALERLFPAIKNQYDGQNIIDQIRSWATGLTESGWTKVGTIYRKAKIGPGGFGRFQFAEIKELPKEVEYIGVDVHKFLSSSVIVTFDVHLSDAANDYMMSLRNQHFLPEIIFHRLWPWNVSQGWTEAGAFVGIQRAILDWIEGIKQEIEEELSHYFVGVFLSESKMAAHKLPSVETFYLEGGPKQPGEFYSWTRKHVRWWASLGFEPTPLTFCNNDYAFVWSDAQRARLQTQHRLVAYPRNGNIDRGATEIETDELLQGLILAVALDRLLGLLEGNIEELRVQALRKGGRIKSTIRLNEKIQQRSAMLERIMMELKQNKPYFRYRLAATSDLKSADPIVHGNLQELLVKQIEGRAKLLKEHLSYIKQLNDGYLTTLNIDVMYRLQIRSLWAGVVGAVFTVVGTFMAAIAVYKDWDTVKSFYHVLEDWIKSFL